MKEKNKKEKNIGISFLHLTWSGKMLILIDCGKLHIYIAIPWATTKKQKNKQKKTPIKKYTQTYRKSKMQY